MPEDKKVFKCLDCETEFDLKANEGVCPKCGADNGAALERARERRMDSKYSEREKADKKESKGRKGLW